MTDGIDCPHAKTFMTPCVARDGHLAVSDPPGAVCVGCGQDPRELRRDLAKRYPPAAPVGRPADDRRAEADRLRDDICGYLDL